MQASLKKKKSSLVYENLRITIQKAIGLSKALPNQRVELLKELSLFVISKLKKRQAIHLLYICTHNSRRSHLGQIWGQVMADYFEIPNLFTYSGGTEITACHPNTLTALREQGFEITCGEGKNPLNKISYSNELRTVECWSKKYDDLANPSKDFIALMTCPSADKNCPLVIGAEKKISLSYEDPKISDGTKHQERTYTERSLQIASEMSWVMQNAKL